MVRLREVTPDDSERMFQWRNRPEVAAYMYTDRPIPRDEHDRWFAAMLADPRRRYWIIEVDGRGVGVTNLVGIDHEHRHCEWAIYLAEPVVRGQGVGEGAGFEVLKVVFDQLGFERLSCEVFAFNDAAIALYTSLGFQREGLLRHHIAKQGRFLDVVVMAILRSEWPAARERLEAREQARATGAARPQDPPGSPRTE